MSALITLEGEALAERLCTLLETPPVITARQARANVPNFTWVNSHDITSPGGWWEANIGSDHGPPDEDDSPVHWHPAIDLIWEEDMDAAWRVVEEMKRRGWLFHIMAMCDGWCVTARGYKLPPGGDWGRSFSTGHMIQEIGDSAPEAICRGAVAALEITK